MTSENINDLDDPKAGQHAQKGERSFRSDHQEFVDILLMTALLAKKLCTAADDFEIYEQFVFHNMDEAMEQ